MMDLSDEAIFSELVFCIFTPQSSAKKCDAAVKRLISSGLICDGSREDIACAISGVRFHNTKSRHAVAARELFSENGKLAIKKKLRSFNSISELREWLIANVYGLGYKESSHFLRNIGLGFDLAILDRHILLNLARHGVIECVQSTSRKQHTYQSKKDDRLLKKDRDKRSRAGPLVLVKTNRRSLQIDYRVTKKFVFCSFEAAKAK